MTDRRPHWDFDLVEAVKAASTKYGAGTVDSAYAVIATVEDWQNHKEADRRYAITLGRIGGKYLPEWIAQSAIDRATKAEAAIARVRERAGGPTPAVHGDWMAGYAAAMRDILRALDDSEDALVQGAITAMLSEDAPLIDPDCRDGKHSSCVGGPCQCPCHELAMRG